MVAHTANKWMRRVARLRRDRSPWKAYVLLFLMLISTVSTVRAGDLKNSGAINNSGQVRVKNAAIGLPGSNGGLYEFFGGNQTLPGRQYQDLKLSGTGTKTADGDATVSGTLTVISGVTLDMTSRTMHLQGTMDEQGYVLGTIDKTLMIIGGSGTTTVGNIGATISWVGVAPGNTTVIRKNGMALTSAATGKQSIKRYYDIIPAINSGLNATLVFNYAASELNGQDPTTLCLWRSVDGGATWRKQGGTASAAQHTITKTGIQSFSRWTASDAANPLGPSFIEGVPQNLVQMTGSGQTANVNTTLAQPMIVSVTDGYGSPIQGVPVDFAVSSSPTGATGQSLSVTSTVTDYNGQAGTVLHLGSAEGSYEVMATSSGLSGSPVSFNATAKIPVIPPVATSFALTSGNGQSGEVYSTLSSPMVVTVRDQFNAPMGGVPVHFSLTSSPIGAAGQKLSDTLVVTDGGGKASTNFRLGTKTGAYGVSASSGSLTGSPVNFTATGIAAPASAIDLPLGNTLTGQVATILSQPLVAVVTDIYGNPISGMNVRFAVTSSPSGASGQTPTDTTISTNALGESRTSFTLGSKPGVYLVQVSAGTLTLQTITINATTSAVAAALVRIAGDGQSALVSTILTQPLMVSVTDAYGNPVVGVGVNFTITSSPSGATGQSLSPTSAVTGSNGQASTLLTLGSREGTYVVTASSGGLSSVTFTETATVQPPVLIATRIMQTSGSGQSSKVGTQLTDPFVVTVLDQFGNAFAGARVTFAITGVPFGDTSASLSLTTASTNVNGQASVRLTLGRTVGVYTVMASSGSLTGSPVSFTATATGETPGLLASKLLMTSGNAQVGTVGSQVSRAMVVTVTDSAGNPVSGTPVHYALASSPPGAVGQSVTTTDAVSDQNGQATSYLVLGSKVGQYAVAVSSGALVGSPVTFTASAVASAPSVLSLISGNQQSASVGAVLSLPLVVSVTDAFGNVVSGTSISFAFAGVPTGATGQAVTPQTVVTDAQGLASTIVTLGSRPGQYAIEARCDALPGIVVSFTSTAAVGAARALVVASGQGQRAVIGSTIAQPLVVTSVDAGGNPVAGVNVQFAITSSPSGASGQNLTTTSAVTDASGNASTVLTVGSITGNYVVSATSNGLSGSPLTFSTIASLSNGAVNIAYASGDAQSGEVLSPIVGSLVATITNADGLPVSGQTVAFAVDSLPQGATGQSLAPSTVTTDAFGRAFTSMTLGSRVGVYRVTATVPALNGSPVLFRLRATLGAPKLLAYVQGSGQTRPINTPLDVPMTVSVVDAGQNPVPGVPVQFAIDSLPVGATGQALRVISANTDAQGQAAAILTTGSKVGAYVVSATSAGLSGSPVKFRASAAAGAPSVLALTSGSDQIGSVLTEMTLPMVVTVSDAGGNPIQGVPVQFTVETAPIGAQGQSVRVLGPQTDAQGQASAFLTLGDRPGRYTVSAAVSGLASVKFAATATMLIGDINSDNSVNIADLTTVIDFILGKITLKSADSVRADFNKDGRIDILDVVAMQNSLLAIQTVSSSAIAGTPSKETRSINTTTGSTADSVGDVRGEFVLTDNGIRFNLTNSAPVKGLQLTIRFRDALSVPLPDIIFDRAQMDSIYLNSSGKELHILAYNLKNQPIPAGDGPLFRLPIHLSDVSAIEFAQIIVSRSNNAVLFDQALTQSVAVRLVKPQELPTSFVLYQNYPNPFNGQTRIKYDVLDAQSPVDVTVQVFNVLGEKIRTLVSARQVGGVTYTVVWDGTDERGTKLSSGAYYYRLISGSFISSKKMIMIK